jgi:biopolymer transport protein ExbB
MKTITTLLLSLTLFSLSLFAAQSSELERAYAKEFAFLKAQKEQLQKRLQSVEKHNTQTLYLLNKDIDSLQNTVLERNTKSDMLGETLFRTQQSAQEVQDDTASLDAVVMQATSALKTYGVEIIDNKKAYQKTLTTIFAEGSKTIDALATVRTAQGKFYLADGTEASGTLVKVGNIATYGVSASKSGALAPAGDNRVKLWSATEASTTATALKNSTKPESLNIFIYESLATEISEKEVKTAYSVIDSGGVIGWVIMGLGAFGLLLIGLRIIFLSVNSSTSGNLAKETLSVLLSSNVDKTLEFLKEKKGSTARLLKATIRNLDRDREHIEDIVAESILHESGRLDRFGAAIMVIAAVSPLLGLLGTVTGMIATFDIITEFGTGDPKLLSGGISIALATTELGLIVAIPLILFGNLLNGWSEKIKDSMEHSALHLINEYAKQKR